MRPIMHGPYNARILTLEQTPQAFPLISITAPGLSLERWLDYAASFFDAPGPTSRGEIVTVQNSDGYIHGLAICHPRPDLHHGRLLDVDNFVTLDLSGGRRAAGVLLDAAEERARAWNCACICVSLLGAVTGGDDPPSRGRPDLLLFQTAGYFGGPDRMAKRLGAG